MNCMRLSMQDGCKYYEGLHEPEMPVIALLKQRNSCINIIRLIQIDSEIKAGPGASGP